MTQYVPPAEGVTTPPEPKFEMYLQGDDTGHVEIICTHRSCMYQGEKTSYNPEGLWLQDVAALPFRPNPEQVAEGWQRHLMAHHGGAA